jgi:hypothetical protein
MRRLLAGAALAAIGLTTVVPLASAHVDPNEHILEWGQSPNPTTANDGGEVWSNDEAVGAYAKFIDGIRSWDVVIRPVNGGPASTCHEDLAQDGDKYPVEVYINCPWDTTRAVEHTLAGATLGSNAANPRFSRTWQSRDLGPAPNGKYTVEITVTNSGKQFCPGIIFAPCKTLPVEAHPLYQPETNPARWRELFVTNDAANPGGVASGFDQANNRISVTWAPNPEPDVSYIVQEKVGDGKWSSGVGVPGARYERMVDQPGQYQYRVAAVRPAPNRDNAGATKRSDYVAASAVNVAQITPPTTAGSGAGPNGGAAGPDGAPAGGDPGASVPTDPTSPTTAGGGSRGPAPGKTSASGTRPSGASSPRPSGSSSRATGSNRFEPGEAEGMGPDDGFSAELPYQLNQGDPVFEEDDGSDEEAGPQTLAGGVVPKPRDTRQLLIYMASALTLFVFAMQLTVLLRRTKPALAATEHYHDDFDDWLGY